MKIYYFGELIEVDGQPVIKETKIQQTKMDFDAAQPDETPQRQGMASIGELLKDIDLSLDVYRPLRAARQV